MPELPNIFKNLPELTMDETKKKILLLYALGLLAILIAYIFLFLSPSLGKLFELIPKMRELKIEITSVNNDLQFEENFGKKLQKSEKEMGKYEHKLSREKEIPVLLENLSQIAKKSRVKILSITPISRRAPQNKKASVYQEVPIAITAQSGYHDLGNFINKLENGQRYMQIRDIEIKTNKNNPKRHEVEFVVYAYTFKGGK